MNSTNRPFWFPDAQGFCMIAVLLMCAAALFIRMFHSGTQEDKMLDTMITILFSTCLVAIINYLFGSSRGSASKDEAINRIATGNAAQPGDAGKIAPLLLASFVIGGLLMFSGDAARAQTPLPKLKQPQVTGDVIADTKANLGIGQQTTAGGVKLTGDPVVDLQAAITKGGQKLIMNLKQSYALAMAKNAAGGSTDNTSASCTKALVPIFDLVVNGPKPGTIAADDPMALTADEQAMAADPNATEGIIVKIEKARILRLALQSPTLNDACGALVQDEVKNAQGLVGKITSIVTGAGMLGIGL